MECKVLHETAGRMRVRSTAGKMTIQQADMLEAGLMQLPGIRSVKVYDRTGDVVIRHETTLPRESLRQALSSFTFDNVSLQEAVADQGNGRWLDRQYQERIVSAIFRRYLKKFFLPMPLQYALAVMQAAGFVARGWKSLREGKLRVEVLDATAITVSLLRGDYNTASSVMFLLNVGEILEEWTHKKSVDALAKTMSLNIDKVWRKQEDQEELVPMHQVRRGDEIVVRTGNMIPLDGIIVHGEAMVNQASMTGESIPVAKRIGSYVYAGTVVEEGECRIQVDKDPGSGRYDRIVAMIEASEKLKSNTEDRAFRLADGLVPYSLGGTLLVYLLTRNVTRALAVLMVDFSCALKLSMPLAVLSAMRECGKHQITVKGGKFLEAVSEADTIVFDKTGTLTCAMPTVARVITFGEQEEKEMLRLAACLEEHYPHSIANAVVEEARRQGLCHEERHSQVNYVVAHGISSMIEGKKAVIGSYHFVFEDEGVVVPSGEEERFRTLPEEYSHLYMAISGELVAVICIEDPLRTEAAAVVEQLHTAGFRRVVMMTGDNERTARAVAKSVGMDEYYSEVLPEDKANFIKQEKEAGHKVIMIGDGINDSPALSEADAGIAICTGAAIAREIADITITEEDLFALCRLKSISDLLMERIRRNYRTIISFNMLLIALGVGGVVPPATSALLHNASTIAIGLHSMTDLYQEDSE